MTREKALETLFDFLALLQQGRGEKRQPLTLDVTQQEDLLVALDVAMKDATINMLRAEASLAAQKAPLAGVRTHSLGSAQENPPIDSVPFGRVKTDSPIWDALVVRRLLLALEAKQDEKLRRLVERIEASGVKLVAE